MKHQAPEKIPPYANENFRFRKAYIRERLATLKAERDALVAEREGIDKHIRDATKETRDVS